MFEQLGARARAAMRHGAEGAERLRGEWLSAGREAYGEAIRSGREVVARTESEIEALGRKAMAEKARLKAAARKSADDAGRRMEAGRTQVGQVIGKAQQGLRNGAITLGNTTTYDGDPSDPQGEWAGYNRDHAAPIWEHERQHTIQGEQLGPFYLPSNLAGGALALVRDGDWHGPSNWNERGPQQPSPQPWPSRRRP